MFLKSAPFVFVGLRVLLQYFSFASSSPLFKGYRIKFIPVAQAFAFYN